MGWVAASRDWGRAADAGWVRALAARHGRRGRIEARCGVVAGSPTSCRGHVVTRRHPIDGAVSAVARRVRARRCWAPVATFRGYRVLAPVENNEVRRVDPGRSITANDAERAACRSRAATICWIASGGYSRSAMRSPASGYTTCRSSTRRAVTAFEDAASLPVARSNSSPASSGTRFHLRDTGAGPSERALLPSGWPSPGSTASGRCRLRWLRRPRPRRSQRRRFDVT